ncbi:MAG TPA: SCO family protein [Aggregatilineaceae bacterium]|nr:SCO family protein [Aggregatilineaceae bacterium]
MRRIASALLLAAWVQAYAHPGDGNTHAHASGQAARPDATGIPEQPFDPTAALKYSQAVIGRSVGEYTLHDRQGRAVKLSDYRGKPLVISLIYTSCYHICPTTTQNLARAVRQARSAVGGADAFTVATIGFDVRNDTPERMGAFAREQHVSDEKNWVFLSADEAAIAQLTTDLGFLFIPSSRGFDHLIQTTVMDANGRIYRQIYGMDFDPGFLTVAMQELVLARAPQALSLSNVINRVRLFCTKFDPVTGMYRFDYSMVFATVIGLILFVAMGVAVARVWRRKPSPGAV